MSGSTGPVEMESRPECPIDVKSVHIQCEGDEGLCDAHVLRPQLGQAQYRSHSREFDRRYLSACLEHYRDHVGYLKGSLR
jgi:hypothetical protein